MTKIGIIGAGTGALPPEVLKMAEEANVEIVELDKDYSPTDTPQFEEVLIYISTLERLESGNPRTSLFCLFNVSSLCPTQSQSIPKT